jgi:DNA repair exonuclease SbcCD ATPase subunit
LKQESLKTKLESQLKREDEEGNLQLEQIQSLNNQIEKLNNSLTDEKKVKSELNTTAKRLQTDFDQLNDRVTKDAAKWEIIKTKLERDATEAKLKLEQVEAVKQAQEQQLLKQEEELKSQKLETVFHFFMILMRIFFQEEKEEELTQKLSKRKKKLNETKQQLVKSISHKLF